MKDELKERIEMVVRPELIIGDYFWLLMPSLTSYARYTPQPLMVDYTPYPFLWRAMMADIEFIYKGGLIEVPKAKYHMIDGSKFIIRTRPQGMHITVEKGQKRYALVLNKPEMKFVLDAMRFYHRRKEDGKTSQIIRTNLHQ